MTFQQLLDSDRFITIAELEPPKGVDTSELNKTADTLRGRAQAVSVPEMSGAVMRMGSLGACCLLQQKGVEPIVNITCRDRNRLALQADLLSAWALGLENILICRGDPVNSGDHIDAAEVQDLDVAGLLEAAKKLQKGIDLAGNELEGVPRFTIGAEVNAGLEGGALEVEVLEMEKRIRAGAQYFFAPTMYDLKHFEGFLEKTAPFKLPVIPEVTILNSVGMARFMCRHIDGVRIPDQTVDRLGKAADKAKESIVLAAEAVKNFKDMCRGVRIVAIGKQERIAAVLEQAGL